MEDTIKTYELHKKKILGRNYVSNLREFVEDLNSIPFNDREMWINSLYGLIHEVTYGSKIAKDKSGVPKREWIRCREGWWELFFMKRTSSLLEHLKKAEKVKNPLFLIKGDYLKKIDLRENDSSTKINMELELFSGATINFKYDTRSYKNEIEKINNSVEILVNRGWELKRD